MGYAILIVLIFIAFGVGYAIGRRKEDKNFEKFVEERRDDESLKKVEDAIAKNKELMKRIKKRLDDEN